uniref:cAMP responsive element binding protein 5 n=1 Tax=Tetraodon nigroviridis TaxID=99883 RepID=H3DM53_TETNG
SSKAAVCHCPVTAISFFWTWAESKRRRKILMRLTVPLHTSLYFHDFPHVEMFGVSRLLTCHVMLPVPGSLSSLLHLRNRQRQPLPASMAGTLPDPTMPGSSAVLMPMERQMSMGSNMMGMQGPTHSSSCSSTHIPSMHSEAKLRLKAALSHHPSAITNGNMNSMGHMMEMMSTRQEQGGHHHMHSHPHQHLQAPPHAYQHHGHHHHNQGPGQGGHHHPQGHNPHHNSHNAHLHGGHPHQTSPHAPMHSSTHTWNYSRRYSVDAWVMQQTGDRLLSRCGCIFIHRDPAFQMSPATQQMQPTQTLQSPPPSGGRRRRVVDEDPDERRRKFLERNRAAATRCRQKRKVWVMSLEKKAEELTQTNMQLQVHTFSKPPVTCRAKAPPLLYYGSLNRSLNSSASPAAQNEVTMLKNEVTQLKQLLLTHKDCPITTMQKESQGYLSPESSPAGSPAPACSQQQVIQHNTITTSTTTVGGSGVHGQTNHRTDINPIH